MRLLHTSDWHLGRTLHGVDLLDHQAAHLDHLVEVVRSEQVDAVLVAGDVYDRAVPPVEAVTLLSDTLARLAEVTTVVLTPGNHDSAARLGFGAALMRERVRVRSRVAGVADPVVLPDERGDTLVYGMPYLDPDVVRHDLAEPGAEPLARSHEAVVTAAMARIRADLARRVAGAAHTGAPRPRAVVVAHAFVVGGEPSDSERDIRVGGVDAVPAGVFAGVDYVALGHLHGAQRIGAGLPGAPLLRYSGSPLAYSFSELRQTKSTVLLDLDLDAALRAPDDAPLGVGVSLVAAPVPRRLAELTGPLEHLLGAAGEAHVEDWLRVTVTDPHRPEDLYGRVRARFPHALVVQHRPPERVGSGVRTGVVTAAHDVLEVATEFVEHVSGAEPTQAEADVLRRAYEQVTAAERSA
ncbi:exonuclease SbcCD subunit D [Cellulomonas sp. P22]|uniref:exonuclease SbcCD subunit D n=1 Tax=Cellulomonas sp. P22 TaxID=3373189 RepID=UPI0037B1746F